jgi:hypothetical protein
MQSKPVIYEVSLELDPAIVTEYDVWLEHHLREVLEIEGFEIGRILRPEGERAPGEWVPRVCQYTVRSRADLQRYLDGPALAMRQKGIDRFGDRFRATRRILDAVDEIATPATRGGGDGASSSCPNCGSSLSDQFCAHCGQENKATVMAFHRIVSDFLGDLFNFDSRLFNSLWPLLVKPGLLTREYVAGRRARFIPPVRMYLFLSLFFFGLATFGIPEDAIRAGDSDDPGEVHEPNTPRIRIGPQGDKPPIQITRTEDETLTPAEPPPVAAGDAEPKRQPTDADFGIKEDDDGNASVNFTAEESGWLYEAEQRAERNVKRFKDDKEFRIELVRRGIGNLPLMMFILLPVYALLLKLLYVRSGRYYVEHLIYSLHLHSFIFLVLGGVIAWMLILDNAGYAPAPPWWLTTVFWTYFALYPFFAMRRMYGQGRFKTALKYLLLGFLYFILLTFGIVGVLLLTLAS